ncbi:hypothetical protein L7F22_050644 [Adiantum nelumboides]|nr:hypothetical protein [Adiantum nelumboides]
MDSKFSKSIKDLAVINSKTEEEVKNDENLMVKVVKKVKSELLDQLNVTFAKLRNGMITCSVRLLVYGEGNDFAIESRTSLVYDSFGAPVCLIKKPGYFIGCHSSDSSKNINPATSTDNMAFVREYVVEHVIPALPPPNSKSWEGMDLKPFQPWILSHRILIGDCGSDFGVIWIMAAEQVFYTTLKRKRDDIET